MSSAVPKKVGRRNLESVDPRLKKCRTAILTVSLSKEWTEVPSYWIEIYASPLGPKGKHFRYYVASQWSFYKKATNEVIDGEIVWSHFTTNEDAPLKFAINKIRERIREKGDVVRRIWTLDEFFHLGNKVTVALAVNEKTKSTAPTPSPVAESRSNADKLKESLARRAKEAKW